MKKFTFFRQLFIMQSFIAFVISSVFVVVVYQNIHSLLVEETRDSAVEQAVIFASNERLKLALKQSDTATIEKLVENIRMPLGTDYVVVADSTGKRMYNTAGIGIGVTMPSYQIVNVLKGEPASFVDYNDEGITNIKSRVPVMENGNVIGIVAVGMSYKIAANRISKYIVIVVAISVLLFIMLVTFSHFFVSYLNRKMLQKSPAQIEVAFNLYESIVNSILEGVVVVDPANNLLAINNAAEKYLNLSNPHESMVGEDISKCFYPAVFFQDHSGEEIIGQTLFCNGERLQVQ